MKKANSIVSTTASCHSTPSNNTSNNQRYEVMSDGSAHHHDNSLAVSPCCGQPQRRFGGNMYHAAPSAPTLEISINQHNPSPVASCYNHYSNRRPPPACSPPPPPTQEGYASPVYNPTTTKSVLVKNSAPALTKTNSTVSQRMKRMSLNGKMKWTRHLYNKDNCVMLRLCLVELILASILLAAGIWCSSKVTDYCPFHSAIWTSSFFIVNSLVGLVAAKMATVNLYVAHLVLSLISVVMCVVGAALAAKNWESIGTYHHPKLSRDHAFCLLGEHDASRISYIFSNMHQYDFRKCLFELKVGIAVNSVQFALVVVLSLLFSISAMLCMKRTCTRCH
uniref:Uncharacterized protein n=1 Tax=Ditylenchus dipsaci TaxID=166011 RepID=A0A915E7D7_9BILA